MEPFIALQFYDATTVGFARIAWENVRHKKNARRVIYKGLQRYIGVLGIR